MAARSALSERVESERVRDGVRDFWNPRILNSIFFIFSFFTEAIVVFINTIIGLLKKKSLKDQ